VTDLLPRLPSALLLLLVSALASCSGPLPVPEPRATSLEELEALFQVETLATGLHVPWDLAWGPDGHLWITERNGHVSRLDPASGRRTPAGHLEVHESRESGLMGLAFHPDFAASPWVYLVHSYLNARDRIENRLVRLRWEGEALGEPEVLLDAIPGHKTHDGSQLLFGPDGYLYMTTGDARRQEEARDPESLVGKVLRLTPEGEPVPGNPWGPVWSVGHRNAQGLVLDPETGLLYATEHGPRDNDEVNLIERAADYGWPDVRGPCDGHGDDAGLCEAGAIREPLMAWTPTIAVAGMDLYRSSRMPPWSPSLLVTALKGRMLVRLPLSDDGRAIDGQEVLVRDVFGRLRAVLVGPDGSLYLATSNRDGNGDPGPEDDRILRLTPRQALAAEGG
jgi:glucose/arabinose dehydrogenase